MRYYAIVKSSAMSTAENAAVNWNANGDGEGTFKNGASLSSDGGSAITHRVCNTLTIC